MVDNDKIPASVFQIDLTRFDADDDYDSVVDTIIKRAIARGASFEEERLVRKKFDEFTVRVFSSVKKYPPKWAKFLQPILHEHSRIRNCKNQNYSYIGFIGYTNQVFAIAGGLGCFSLEEFISHNFGLEVLVRLFEKDSKVIKSIQERGVTGIVLGQTKFYRGDQRFSDENQFGKIFKQIKAELNQKILTKTFGFANAALKRKVSGCMAKSSFQINKAIGFDTLLPLIKRFTEILKQPENFTLN